MAQALNALPARQGVRLAAGGLRFVPQAELPPGEAYESFIFRTGCVPTRDHLHDFFNGLVWLAEPAFKVRLNALHAQVLAVEGVQPRRGALLQAPADAVALLRARRWRELLAGERARWLRGEIRLRVIGHALMEQLVLPYKGITAQVRAGGSAAGAQALRPRPFLPLPVLGVPGWWAHNGQPAFYEDEAVFRPLPSPVSAASLRLRPLSLAR